MGLGVGVNLRFYSEEEPVVICISTHHRVFYRDGYIILAGDDIDVDVVIVGVINL